MLQIGQQNAEALTRFLTTPLDQLLSSDGSPAPPGVGARLDSLARQAAAATGIYRRAGSGSGAPDFAAAPFLGKRDFGAALRDRVAGGRVAALEAVHVSSGSGGAPAFWGRGVAEELDAAVRFELIFADAFRADAIDTLAVVALPMGSWVGGVFSTFCIRYLAQKGYSISVISPGNNIPELLRVIASLAPLYKQTVIIGYPPFVKTLIDQGNASGIPWSSFDVKCIFAGEVFSEEWRSLVAQRAGIQSPLKNIVSIYGTADCGVLANETLLSASIRSYLAKTPTLMKKLFGKDRIPSFMQYDPMTRYFEKHPEDGTLVVSTLPPKIGVMSMPLVRYCIGDDGGIIGFDELMDFLRTETNGSFDVLKELEGTPNTVIRRLPFVWVFGRAFWTVSLYGANVFVENVMVGLEQPEVCHQVSGKFVLAVNEDPDDVRLLIHVELGSGIIISDEIVARVAESILNQLKRLNSEYANYVPADKQSPIVKLYLFGDALYFPVGVKHSYILR